jgi:hypothetical protein
MQVSLRHRSRIASSRASLPADRWPPMSLAVRIAGRTVLGRPVASIGVDANGKRHRGATQYCRSSAANRPFLTCTDLPASSVRSNWNVPEIVFPAACVIAS